MPSSDPSDTVRGGTLPGRMDDIETSRSEILMSLGAAAGAVTWVTAVVGGGLLPASVFIGSGVVAESVTKEDFL